MKIIVAIPAYNEEKTLPNVIKEIREVMDNSKYKKNYDILITNDGSEDNTEKVAKELKLKVISHRHKGLAETFKKEIEECLKLKADIIVHTDADGQYLAKDIPRLIQEIENGYDLVIGSRFYSKSNMPLSNQLGNKAFAKVFSRLLEQKITDTTTGFRAFTKDVAKEIQFINTFTYTQEQLIKAKKQGFKIKEIPIETRHTTRPSRLFKSPMHYAIKAWINIIRIYRDYDPIKFFGKFGLSIMGLGFIFGIYLVIKFIVTKQVTHIPLAILTILLIILGFQTIIFGFLADMKK